MRNRSNRRGHEGLRNALVPCAVLALGLAPAGAHASFLSGDLLDTVADWLAIFVLFLVPVVAIVVFWIVHVLPEKIAEKRHHPQKEGITTLCLLSLVFGGMLWPLAWIWAYTRPVLHRAAYGTDRHEDYFVEMAAKAREGTLLREELSHLRQELEAMEARGALPPNLQPLKEQLAKLREEEAVARAAAAEQRGGAA